MKKKPIHINLFEYNCVGHMVQGLWAHPDNNRHKYKSLEFWQELARLAEAGLLDGIFFADVLGVYEGSEYDASVALENAVQVPSNDASLVITAMAMEAKYLGFHLTASMTYENLLPFAGRLSDLQGFTSNRIGWNAVTSYLHGVDKSFGIEKSQSHDEKYAQAEYFMEGALRAWGIHDSSNNVTDLGCASLDKPYVRLASGSYSSSTPLICQATNGSEKGIEFAAKYTEVVLIGGKSRNDIKRSIEAIKASVHSVGRALSSIKFIVSAGVIVGKNKRDVERKLKSYRDYHCLEGRLVQMQLDPDLFNRVDDILVGDVVKAKRAGWKTLAERYDPKEKLKDIVSAFSDIPKGCHFIAGTPEEVANQIEHWVDNDGIDGINLRQYLSFETLQDFVELVVPVLQQRGRFRRSYEGVKSLRQRYFEH